MTQLKTILFSGVLALGIAACHHDRDTNTPANNTYGTSGDQNQPGAAHSYGTTGTGADTSTPDVNGNGQSGAAGVQNGASAGASGTSATSDQNTTSGTPSASPGAINSTTSAGNNSANQQRNGARTNGTYNNTKDSTPSSTNGTNTNTDSDMSRTGNSGTTKEGNPGTADPSDR